MIDFKPNIGKELINILMFQMYPTEKTIYREYIQNACDAIKEACKQGVLSQTKDGRITVTIDDNKRKISIHDNGIGVPFAKVEPTLLNIADSLKDGYNTAGQFGIGRLVGAGYCKTLSFKTSFKGEDKASEIVFDIEKARKILCDTENTMNAATLIATIAEKHEYKEEVNNHYFVATLDDILDPYTDLLNEERIVSYLKEVAPIDYGMSFKNNLIHKSLKEEFRSLQGDIPNYNIAVNNELDIRKRYGMTIEGTGDDIHELEYFKLQDDQYGLLAWGWYAVTAFTKAIPTSDINRGIRLRKHNILIGESNFLNQYFKEPRGNNYFYGEIHAVNQNIIPESSRSGLAPTPEAMCLISHLRDYFNTLVQLYHVANDAKNAVKEYSQAIVQKNKEQPIENVSKEKLEAAKKKIESIVHSKNAQTETAKKVINIIKKDIDKIDPPELDLDTQFKPEQKIFNIFDPLKKKYSDDKILLIRQIFTSLTDNCPCKDKKLIEELKKKVVKDLAK